MQKSSTEKVRNLDVPDLQKYLDYYKWLDAAMSQMLDQLMHQLLLVMQITLGM